MQTRLSCGRCWASGTSVLLRGHCCQRVLVRTLVWTRGWAVQQPALHQSHSTRDRHACRDMSMWWLDRWCLRPSWDAAATGARRAVPPPPCHLMMTGPLFRYVVLCVCRIVFGSPPVHPMQHLHTHTSSMHETGNAAWHGPGLSLHQWLGASVRAGSEEGPALWVGAACAVLMRACMLRPCDMTGSEGAEHQGWMTGCCILAPLSHTDTPCVSPPRAGGCWLCSATGSRQRLDNCN